MCASYEQSYYVEFSRNSSSSSDEMSLVLEVALAPLTLTGATTTATKRGRLRTRLGVRPHDLTRYHDATPAHGASRRAPAFGLPRMAVDALTRRESGVRADVVHVAAHGSGTHTECVGHVEWDADLATSEGGLDATVEAGVTAAVHVVVRAVRWGDVVGEETYVGGVPQPEPSELVVSRRALEEAFVAAGWDAWAFPTVVVSVRDDEADGDGDGLPPTPRFWTDQAIAFVKDRGCVHLAVNQESIDRAVCGPRMPAHRGFFFVSGGAGARRRGALITELLDTRRVPAGLFVASLQLAPLLGTDAVPSRLILYEGDVVV